VVQLDCQSDRDSQDWAELFVDGPWAVYVAVHSGKCLDVSSDGRSKGSTLVQADCDATRLSQYFRFYQATSDRYQVISRASGLCVDVAGASAVNGAQYLIWDCLGAEQRNQLFMRMDSPVNSGTNAIVEPLLKIGAAAIGLDLDPEVCWKSTYGRGAGSLPDRCPADREPGNLPACYERCRPGYSSDGAAICYQNCPAGFRNDLAFCAKPDAYGRGAGYAYFWPFETIASARARCERDKGAGNCERWGELYYPKCAAGYQAVGCCVCSPICPQGMTDIGVSCAKDSYWRGAGTPLACPPSQEQDAIGLCYPRCEGASKGVGPICWAQCRGEFETDCAAACAKSDSACAFSIIEQVGSTADLALNVTSLVLTGGAATPLLRTAQVAGKKLAKKGLQAGARAAMKASFKQSVKEARDWAKRQVSRPKTAEDWWEKAGNLETAAELFVTSYENGEFDWQSLVPSAADVEPTGILAVVNAFAKPICK
jgi:hypothetical protein